MEEKQKRRRLFAVLLGLVLLALLGALWAWKSQPDCGACGSVRDLAGGGSLARVGAVTYALLLVAGLTFGASRLFFVGIQLAAAAHLALLFLLARRGVLCTPCVLTGLAAIAAALLSFVMDPAHLARAGILMPLVAVGAAKRSE